MQIIDNKALLFDAPDPDVITQAIRKSATTDNGVLVYWGHKEAEALANLRLPAPSPLLRDYKWTGRFTPFAHQRETASFLSIRRRAFCFSEAGTGKTASVIWAADYLMKKGLVKRVLVICPLSIMKSAWQKDLFTFAMHRSCGVAHGSATQRRKVINGGYDFVIINFDGLSVVKDEVAAGGFDLIVADEASYLKNAQTARWKVMNQIVKATDPRLWLLTGTPAAQSPVDAYGLAKLVNPEGCPRYFTEFKASVMTRITQFKWIPKPTAPALVHELLQPAIRFEKKDCLDLPEVTHVEREAPLTPQQAKYYKQLRDELLLEADGEEVSAVNAATKINKLLQVSCIAEGTPVLTTRGWVSIQEVTPSDRVWDGVEWVHCDGACFMGNKHVIELDGVCLTPDHQVLTVSGWREAKDCLYGDASIRLDRTAVRLPDGYPQARDFNREKQESYLAVRVHVRANGGSGVPELANKAPTKRAALRVSPWGAYPDSRDVVYQRVPHMEGYAEALLRPATQGLRALWSTGYNSVRTLGQFVRRVLGGYGPDVQRRADARAHRQQRPLHAEKLSVGDRTRAVQQYSREPYTRHSHGAYDGYAGSRNLRPAESDSSRAHTPLWLDRRTGTDNASSRATYDILNCGPRSRFIVRGVHGQHMIVHNCGAAYTDDGNVVEFDVSNRLNVVVEAIEETSNKVLVFVPFTHTIELLRERLEKEGISCGVINGAVSVNKRSQLVDDFQTRKDPHVLIIQPQAASHGLTLTAADTIIWYAPVTSVETYLQANARIDRPGQKNAMTIVHIKGSPVEDKLYTMLQNNIDHHEKLIDLYREVMA